MTKKIIIIISPVILLVMLLLLDACGGQQPFDTSTPTTSPTKTPTQTGNVSQPTTSPTKTPTQTGIVSQPTTSTGTPSATVFNTNSLLSLVSFGDQEKISSIALDEEGNFYIGVKTDLPSPFIRKYNGDGNEIWTHNFGGIDRSPILDIVVDGSGNIVVLCPGTITKFDNDGAVLSTIIFDFPHGLNPNTRGLVIDKRVHIQTGETELSPSPISVFRDLGVRGFAVDERGNAFVVGYGWVSFDNYSFYGTLNAFLARFDSSGNMISFTLIGYTRTEPPHSGDEPPLQDEATSVAVDTLGNIYIAGYTCGDLANRPEAEARMKRMFLNKYSEDGSELWRKEVPCAGYGEIHVIVDNQESVYLAGGYVYVENAGPMFVRKYESTGIELWTRYVPSGKMMFSDLALDNAGCSYITTGDLVRKYDTNGNEVWTQDLTKLKIELCSDIEVDNSNNIYLTGVLKKVKCIARIAGK